MGGKRVEEDEREREGGAEMRKRSKEKQPSEEGAKIGQYNRCQASKAQRHLPFATVKEEKKKVTLKRGQSGDNRVNDRQNFMSRCKTLNIPYGSNKIRANDSEDSNNK